MVEHAKLCRDRMSGAEEIGESHLTLETKADHLCVCDDSLSPNAAN